MYLLFPKPKSIRYQDGGYSLKNQYTVFFQTEMENAFERLGEFLNIALSNSQEADFCFLVKPTLAEEAYEIEIRPTQIVVFYSTNASAYYAATTLKQVFFGAKQTVRCFLLEDEPDFRRRGFMLDISRNKVPTVQTIKQIIDFMSDLKMNHFELYVEGFSFEYQSFKQYLEEDGYISVLEYLEIEAYAKQRMIDLVPNQNGFGHMAKWLATDEFKDLAEVPEGVHMWGRHRPPNTLNPLDPRSIELIKNMYKDMLPHSSSDYFNMNFDEPFELGKGKSKQACEKDGLGNVYLDYALQAYDEIKKYNKTPLMWGDVLINHPELLHRLPKDLIFVDWGYDGPYPFNKNLKKLRDANIRFMAAPGTTSWCSFAGRTQDWIENITNACIYTKAHGGEGVLLTDWGDFGHLQFLPTIYAPLAYHAMMTWRVQEGTYFTLKNYLNQYIFKDETNMFADIMMDLGNYYRYENHYLSNGTPTFYSFMWAIVAMRDAKEDPMKFFADKVKLHVLSQEKYRALKKFLNQKIEEIQQSRLTCEQGDLIKEEMLQTIYFIKTIQKVLMAFNDEVSLKRKGRLLEEVQISKERLINGHTELWLARNKSGGLQDTLTYVEDFVRFAEVVLKDVIRRGEENDSR